MLQLSEQYQTIVLNILKPLLRTHKVYAFGSRARHTAKKFSDLDLCIEGEKLSFEEVSTIKDQFTDSDLPYFVDLLQKCHLSKKMYDNIKNEFVVLNSY